MTDAPRPATGTTWLARYLAWRRRPDPALARLQCASRALTVAVERAVVRRRLLQAELAATRRALDRAEATTQRLRAILKPLLDRPYVVGTILCQFCRTQAGSFDEHGGMTGTHAPDCPTLEKDALLGLLDAPVAGPGRASTKEDG
jgi:hypothetical protein